MTSLGTLISANGPHSELIMLFVSNNNTVVLCMQKKGSVVTFVCIPNMSGLDIANTYNKKKHHHKPHRVSDNFHAPSMDQKWSWNRRILK
jgi:hypothetical protein